MITVQLGIPNFCLLLVLLRLCQENFILAEQININHALKSNIQCLIEKLFNFQALKAKCCNTLFLGPWNETENCCVTGLLTQGSKKGVHENEVQNSEVGGSGNCQ